jgi:hypothetical protein
MFHGSQKTLRKTESKDIIVITYITSSENHSMLINDYHFRSKRLKNDGEMEGFTQQLNEPCGSLQNLTIPI